jgi:hypothetical protein
MGTPIGATTAVTGPAAMYLPGTVPEAIATTPAPKPRHLKGKLSQPSAISGGDSSNEEKTSANGSSGDTTPSKVAGLFSRNQGPERSLGKLRAVSPPPDQRTPPLSMEETRPPPVFQKLRTLPPMQAIAPPITIKLPDESARPTIPVTPVASDPPPPATTAAEARPPTPPPPAQQLPSPLFTNQRNNNTVVVLDPPNRPLRRRATAIIASIEPTCDRETKKKVAITVGVGVVIVVCIVLGFVLRTPSK